MNQNYYLRKEKRDYKEKAQSHRTQSYDAVLFKSL